MKKQRNREETKTDGSNHAIEGFKVDSAHFDEHLSIRIESVAVVGEDTVDFELFRDDAFDHVSGIEHRRQIHRRDDAGTGDDENAVVDVLVQSGGAVEERVHFWENEAVLFLTLWTLH